MNRPTKILATINGRPQRYTIQGATKEQILNWFKVNYRDSGHKVEVKEIGGVAVA